MRNNRFEFRKILSNVLRTCRSMRPCFSSPYQMSQWLVAMARHAMARTPPSRAVRARSLRGLQLTSSTSLQARGMLGCNSYNIVLYFRRGPGGGRGDSNCSEHTRPSQAATACTQAGQN